MLQPHKLQAVEQWPLDRLLEYERNPRQNDHAVSQAAAAIKEFGFRVPILAKSDGLIIDGHLRLKAARLLGLETVPVLLADDLTDVQIKAFRLSVNKIADLADWDADLLAVELDELRDLKFDLGLMGFAPGELNDLIGTPNTGFDPDDVPPAPVVPVSRTGDLWICGDHKILCGDSTKPADVARLMGGAKAGLCLTDPPYGIDIVKVKGGSTGKLGGESGPSPYGGTRGKGRVGFDNLVAAGEYFPITGDDRPFDPAHLLDIAGEQIMFGANYFASKLPDGKAWIVWDKDASGMFSPCELAWTSRTGRLHMYRHMWSGLRREGSRDAELTKRVHPTQKPVGLFEAILADFSAEGAVIIDPYLGSGTTLIACERTGRRCAALEIEPHYCDVSVMRFETLTGKQATLDGDGRTFEEVKNARQTANPDDVKASQRDHAQAPA